jgi:hypothetical protein
MKKKYEVRCTSQRPADWDRYCDNDWLKNDVLHFDETWEEDFTYHFHPEFGCYTFKRKMNLFTFGKFKLHVPITMVALPVSIDGEGYFGNLEALMHHLQEEGGLFLILNIRASEKIPQGIPSGRNLDTCIFDNIYEDFNAYVAALRSPYRRRLKQALTRLGTIRIEKIHNENFDDQLYALYKAVLNRSKYPLETLPIEFFKISKDEIHVFYHKEKSVAFVMVKVEKDRLYFLFGGMNYDQRDTFDLYYNMLIYILKLGIKQKVKTIYFGQTAESSKERLGCRREKRYMCIFTGNRLVNKLLSMLIGLFEYKSTSKVYHVFTKKT